ncbi:amidase [Agrobacterium sp. Azo12]|uniref:amidase n=1 Tax=Agrobacterium sp. Azo12 TaxID=3031129 RepID=UPI0023D7C74D|nr:amidase [Agrobacterium sp. Azo12]MDO5897674.1 amidase [Agrobacterium sp. Azo12]
MPDISDAFIQRFDHTLQASPVINDQPLSGLSVAAKDNFDIRGLITGAGNPEFAEEQKPAAANAGVVDTLLKNGASIIGKTHMDELAYSLMGLNARYGVPLNTAAPSRVPGGSSSGSASAVAADLADIGLGTDTGGSVRLPASFCGLYGWRSTHGLISSEGMVPLAASYDVSGFFTRDRNLMERIISVFCQTSADATDIRYWAPEDLWALPMDETREHFRSALPDFDYRLDTILPDGGAEASLSAFRLHQGYEIWQHFGEWITKRQPAFGPGIKERFAMASKITEAEFKDASAYRERLRARLDALLPEGTILLYPTAPGPAPLLTTPQSELEPYRNRALSLMSVAGHAGLPQLSIPFGTVDGAPVGLSLVGRPGSDLLLIKAAASFQSF